MCFGGRLRTPWHGASFAVRLIILCYCQEEGFPHNEDGTVGTPSDPFNPDSPPASLNIRGREGGKVGNDPMRTLRVGRKDRKKAGDGLRGKNVTEAFRVKEKDLKRTMK